MASWQRRPIKMRNNANRGLDSELSMLGVPAQMSRKRVARDWRKFQNNQKRRRVAPRRWCPKGTRSAHRTSTQSRTLAAAVHHTMLNVDCRTLKALSVHRDDALSYCAGTGSGQNAAFSDVPRRLGQYLTQKFGHDRLRRPPSGYTGAPNPFQADTRLAQDWRSLHEPKRAMPPGGRDR